MYLALTNEDKNILTKKKIILLGEWCNSKEFFKKNTFTAPYYLQNINDAKKSNEYIYSIYKKFILILAKTFNQKLNLEKEPIFWEMLVGDWLWNFISILFDRYSSIKNALENYEITEASIYKNIYPIYNYLEFYNLNQNDHFNHIIFSELIQKIKKNKNIKIKVINNDISDLKKLNLSNKKSKSQINYLSIKSIIRSYYYKIIKFIASRKNILFNINIPFGYLNKKLVGEIGDIFYINYEDYSPPNLNKEINYINRKFEIEGQVFKNEFEYILSKEIEIFLPQEYFENFNKFYNYYLEKIPKKTPKVVGLRSPNEFSTEIRFMTAILKEKKIENTCLSRRWRWWL